MGVKANISADTKPKQGSWLGRRVEVCYHYDTSKREEGRIIREDAEGTGISIILLDSGFPVLTTECQYSPIKE